MQRTFVAIALALTLSCTLAVFTPTNYVKPPVQVVQDGETNYTNRTNGTLSLGSVNAGELDLIAPSVNPNSASPVNLSANSYNVLYRKLDSKSLTGTANSTVNFTQPLSVFYSNGYAVSITTDNDAGTNNIPQVTVYQTAISNGNALARITLSTNTINTYTPTWYKYQIIGKNVYVFYLVNNTNSTGTPSQVNVTSFTVGSATKGSLEFNLTTTFSDSLNVVWGEALGSNQVYANWLEGPANARVLKYTTIDVTKGTYNATVANAWTNTSTCRAFSTDKKWYGDFCTYVNSSDTTNKPVYYSIRYANNTFLPFNNQQNVTLYSNTSLVSSIYPYGPYIALFYNDTVTTQGSTTYSYELWNIDTLATYKNKTTFLVTDLTTTFFRVVSGGLYSLSYNMTVPTTNTSILFTNVQVGQVLSGSYLTSILGFIMTIVAGVLLF